jgi:hypothetical protein
VATTRSGSELSLGPVAHIGLVVRDLTAAMETVAATGTRWSSVTTPSVVLQLADGVVERVDVRYVAGRGSEPRIKLIEGPAGSYFGAVPGQAVVHHLAYWVDDLEEMTYHLLERGYNVEATGLEPDGVTPRYRYLLAPGLLRVELGLIANRAEFDAWAG